MRILRSADYRRMPWKNGGGETVEVAVFPPDATIADFDWRISMAGVSQDGPFSAFEGVDRTLSILSGNGMMLSVEGRQTVALFTESEPYAFPADISTSAGLKDGAITDLNVMTRRTRFSHRVTRLFGPGVSVAASAAVTAILSGGPIAVAGDLAGPLDMIFLSAGERIDLQLDRAAPVFLIELSPV